jgi:hypothetical protein
VLKVALANDQVGELKMALSRSDSLQGMVEASLLWRMTMSET